MFHTKTTYQSISEYSLALSLSLSKTRASKKRFSEVSSDELEGFQKKIRCHNTERAHQWAFKVYSDWISGVSEYSLADLWCENEEKVCNLLSKFVAEARRSNGSFYTPKTLVQLLSNLQSAAYARNPKARHFMDAKNIAFKPLHNVLNNMCKRLLSDGVGAQKKQARVLTRREEETG